MGAQTLPTMQSTIDRNAGASERRPIPARSPSSIIFKLFLSHILSAWNSRNFEFAAVLFLASIFPGTLLYASIYALVRAAAVTIMSGWIGSLVDRAGRLTTIRQSIIWQRIPVALSCLLLLALYLYPESRILFSTCFPAVVLLACVEKLAVTVNTVAVERDWLVVIADGLDIERHELNASMRRIDLTCKLAAPVFVSFVDAYSTSTAIIFVFCLNLVSVAIEYMAIARVYRAVPELLRKNTDEEKCTSTTDPSIIVCRHKHSGMSGILDAIGRSIQPWKAYFASPLFLPSFALSLLYLTVLSTGVQMQTVLFSTGFTPIQVSLLRVLAVVLEIVATCVAPIVMKKIGPVRSGLWFVNWQLGWVTAAVAAFIRLDYMDKLSKICLIGGVIISRVGLWGFDLSVQYLVQEETPESSRGRFSSSEMALQNLFELISFASTIVFPRPKEFEYPSLISIGAIAVASACFAAFVRHRRGHLLHASKCMKRERYDKISQIELDEVQPEAERATVI